MLEKVHIKSLRLEGSMRSYHNVIVVAVSVSLCACNAPDKLPWGAASKPVGAAKTNGGTDGVATPDDMASANADLLLAANHCLAIYNLHGRNAGAAGMGQWSVGTIGVLAGSVFMPITKGTAATAWSGLSGAANALQLSMNEALSASVELSRQQRVAQAAQEGLKAVLSPNADKSAAAIKMAFDCSVAAGLADYESMRRMSGATPIGQIQRGVQTPLESGAEFTLPNGWTLEQVSSGATSSVIRAVKPAEVPPVPPPKGGAPSTPAAAPVPGGPTLNTPVVPPTQ